jgi:hypothetical protein
MHLESSVFVRRPPEDVWWYLGDVSNVAAWDRGVSRTEVSSPTPPGIGFEFDTFAHPRGKSRDGAWGKMSYRIAETDPVRGCTIQLTSSDGNARYFKSAEWRFRVEAEPGGSRVFCAAVFSLKLRYLILAPVLITMRNAIRNDLEQLKKAIEKSE